MKQRENIPYSELDIETNEPQKVKPWSWKEWWRVSDKKKKIRALLLLLVVLLVIAALMALLAYELTDICHTSLLSIGNPMAFNASVPRNLKVAFFGDQGLKNTSRVFPIFIFFRVSFFFLLSFLHSTKSRSSFSPSLETKIKGCAEIGEARKCRYGTSSGRFGLSERSRWLDEMITSELGENFPYFVAIGNHDVGTKENTKKYRFFFSPKKYFVSFRFLLADGKKTKEKWTDYQRKIQARMERNGMNQYCHGEIGIKEVCNFQGFVFLLSGVGTACSGHEEFLQDTLEAYSEYPWRVCAWHKNQRRMQTEHKSDEVGWEPYEVTTATLLSAMANRIS
jgi:hypothetical protein